MVNEEVSNHCRFLRARIFSRRMELWVEIMFGWNEVVNRKVSKWTTCSKQTTYQHIEGRKVPEKKGSLKLVSLVGSADEWICRRLNVGWFEDIKECFQLVHLRCYRVNLLISACSLETEILNTQGGVWYKVSNNNKVPLKIMEVVLIPWEDGSETEAEAFRN
ncbi:hypothetical protein Tco_1556057 [Tanacetum coccineum]